jgi:hypothetical protein
LAYWYIVTAAISWAGMFAVLGRNATIGGWLGATAAGSTLAGVMLRDVVEVRLLAGYRVFLKFDDGVQGEAALIR